jgi:hypothetical protein
MSILDDAIREHLELKRAHGADAAELKKLEDEAFGPPARPDELDPLAEAPTEFLATEGGEDTLAGEGLGGRRIPNIADLQEAPEPRAEEASEPAAGEAAEESEPAEADHSTGERQAIAEQPTEHFDVEAEIESGAEASSPSDEDLLDAEASEPRLPVDPPTVVDPAAAEPAGAEPEIEEPAAEEEEDDFFSEQRLSDELSQALDAPIAEEHPIPETDEHDQVASEEEVEAEHEDEGEEYEEDDDDEPRSAAPDREDVLEDTPEFLEDTPEDDDLWFEQRPPKDFDFDD